ncbi:hypothetical protein B0A48_12423 [Cryoendolithus antarcticus]|uniref:Cyanovirin-N domain-containing protein n=1 Tax=Cryoendolithus antarcticus TaxID=1507870 RepID=A0A1V8SS97_9PEZI|nr:hypothetical protein B0A48_12423 [Cryoendolithus antarcticus]OQO30049.1 hypothetical protein B0A51_02734 [Rachicladosporium sp. CCFEE 5018]OQO30104.1 hypothetical protein B0A51_02666 [Rachicladosporium sp. CCFEE 5018]OQO30527.1 hypothetical protein B0A51_02376 [Rachicladosporium sp. CCFEE 5018]
MVDFIMGLGLALPITSAVGVATVTGVGQGVSEQQRQNADSSNQVRMLKFHLDVRVETKSGSKNRRRGELQDAIVTLHDDKLWLEAKDPETGQPKNPARHPFTGFYVAYPDTDRDHTRGLVSTISRDPPVLNWIYVNKDTLECKYSSRSGSIAHHVGSFDWTTEENENSRITLDEYEGFVAVDEGEKKGWALYFDMEDDGLKDYKKGRTVCEVSLVRRLLETQDLNKWGLKEEGNIGFKKTREAEHFEEITYDETKAILQIADIWA